MFDYLQKFNKLPKELRDEVSTPAKMAAINVLEEKYSINLASVVMKIMVKEVLIQDLVSYFIKENNLEKEKAEALVEELKDKIFRSVANYLNFQIAPAVLNNQSKITPNFSVTKSPDVLNTINKKDFSPQSNNVETSESFFSPHDEEEIRELAKKINNFGAQESSQINSEQIIEQVIEQTKIKFGSEALLSRFKNILAVYLKGIRDRIETKQTMMKSVNEGGLHFDQNAVDKIFKAIESVRNSTPKTFVKPPRIKVPEDDHIQEKSQDISELGSRDVPYDLAGGSKKFDGGRLKVGDDGKVIEQGTGSMEQRTENIEQGDKKRLAPPPPAIMEQGSKNKEQKAKDKKRLAPPPPAISEKVESKKLKVGEFSVPSDKENYKMEAVGIKDQQSGKIKKIIGEIKKEPKIEKKLPPIKTVRDIEPVKKQAKPTMQARKISEPSGKRRMDDVKKVPKVMSPIDELAYLNLVNFRRLGSTPEEATQKVKQKIELLGEERYSKRLEGIKAWRRSPVNRLYLQIGNESISQAKGIDAIIEEMTKKGENALSVDEFNAVMKLNKEIRF